MPILGTIASSRLSAVAETYELISSATLGSNSSKVTISSIPQTYTDLVLKVFSSTIQSNASWADLKVRLNDDSAANYKGRLLWASQSAPTGQSESGTYFTLRPNTQGTTSPNTNTWGQAECYITNYTTSQFKTVISTDSAVWLNAGAGTGIWQHGTSWRNTAAVTSITFEEFSSPPYAILAGSVFTLYGIKRK
jgi:hypothetical protein